jgi:hypothetical protein
MIGKRNFNYYAECRNMNAYQSFSRAGQQHYNT